MRILHVIPQLWRGNGAAKIVKDLVDYQITHGNLVTVVSLSIMSPSYEKDLKKLGCEVIYLENRRYSLYNPKFFFQLRKIIKEFDIVHVHLFPALYWVALAKYFSSASCKLVLTEHSTFNNRQSFKILKPIERFIYSKYDAIVAISEGVSLFFKSYLGNKYQFFVINNGVNVKNIRQCEIIGREQLNLSSQAKLIVQIGRFYPQKDQKTLIKALALLPDDFYVLFVGDGPLLDEYQRLAQYYNLSKRILFLSVREDAISILKASDIVVMSSNFEGFGLAAVEGMAAGKPVIASDVEGLSNIVEGAGLLFEPHNEKDLAAKIRLLMEDQLFYKSVSEKCKQRSEKYDVSVMGNRYNQLYQSLCR